MADLATHPLVGTWRIIATDLWDERMLDLDEPAFIAFDADDRGKFSGANSITGELAIHLGDEGWFKARRE